MVEPLFPFRSGDEDKKSEQAAQSREDSKRASEVMHGKSALKKYEPAEAKSEDDSGNDASESTNGTPPSEETVKTQTEEMRSILKEEIKKKIQESNAKKMEWMKSGLSLDEYVEKQLG